MPDEALSTSDSQHSRNTEQPKPASGKPRSPSAALKIIEPWADLMPHLNGLHSSDKKELLVDTYLLNLKTRLDAGKQFSKYEKIQETNNLALVTRSLLAQVCRASGQSWTLVIF